MKIKELDEKTRKDVIELLFTHACQGVLLVNTGVAALAGEVKDAQQKELLVGLDKCLERLWAELGQLALLCGFDEKLLIERLRKATSVDGKGALKLYDQWTTEIGIEVE